MRLIEQIERQSPNEGSLRIWYLGANSLVLQTHRARLYIDPFLVPAAMHDGLFARRGDPPVIASEVREFDGVLITHEHKDHCNPYTLRELLQMRSAPVVAPRVSAQIVQGLTRQAGVRVARPGDAYTLGGFDIEVCASGDTVATDAVAYRIRDRQFTLYVAGDLLFLPDHAVSMDCKLDAAFLPIATNPPGRRFYLSAQEWAEIARELAPTHAVPVHWDVWAEYDLDPMILSGHYPGENLTIIPVGSYLELRPDPPIREYLNESECHS